MLTDFYTVTDFKNVDTSIQARIKVNAEHKIFLGHFPNQPVVPGVCMMQIVKELVENETKIKLLLAQADTMKFLAVWIPSINEQIEASIAYEKKETGIMINGSLFSGDTTFFKIKAFLKIA